MELLIGNKIKKLRRDRELTQEEVAAHLGVSFQAVSKWERGDGYPDITLLPALANYFRVTVDELLGMDEIAARKSYDRANESWQSNNAEGLHAENVQLMKNMLKRFPNDSLLLVQLSTSLEKCPGTQSERKAYLQESIAVQEQILRYGEDQAVRNATAFNICFAYQKAGQMDKAIGQARLLPNLYKTRENALVHFLQGEEKQQLAREALRPLGWALKLHLTALGQADKAEEVLRLIGENSVS